VAKILKPGMRFEDLVRANIDKGTNADAIGREEEHVRERLELHRNPKGPITRTLTDGTRFVILESRMPDGGTVVTETDITDRARLEERAEAERRLLLDAIESIEGGAILYDADDRIVLCNSVYRERLKDIEELLVPGARFEDVVRAVAETGILAGAKEDVKKHVRERMARHRSLQPSLFHNLRMDRWVLLREYRTSDGGTLIIHTDITEQKRTEEALRTSEQRFRDFAESASDWYWQTGPDHRCTFVSDRFFDETGFHPADIVGKTFAEFVGREIVAENRDMWRTHKELMARQEPFQNFEFAQRDAEGTRQHVRISGRPFFDADNAFAGYRGVATDITERHDTEAALRRSEERLRDISEAAADWFWETGPDFRYTFVSDRFYEESGLRPADVLGRTRLEFVGPRLVDKDEAAWHAHQDDLEHHRQFRSFEYCRHDPDGNKVRYKRVTGKPFFDRNGAFLGYRGNTTDITEYRRTEQELIQHKKMESLGSLAGGIAHNLNNTLQPIMILSQMTRDAFPKGTAEHQNLQFINQACARAKELVERILAFSREKSYRFRNADIHDLVKEELNLIRRIVPSNVTIRQRLNKKTGTVFVDPIQTQTVLMNIVANAVDAFDGRPGKVQISLARARVGSTRANAIPTLKKGSYAKLTVADDGPGMDEKTLGRIFDPFFTTKPPGKGTGLGLSTAIGIVYKQGGTIRAASGPGKGAVFDVFLPLKTKAKARVRRKKK
jgi:PAS domain S-box-containing protein